MTAEALDTTLVDLIVAHAGLDVPADQSFFQAGLTSAHVVLIHERLQEVLGRELPISVFFEHPTRRALVDHLVRGGDRSGPVVRTDGNSGWTTGARRDLRAGLRQRRRRG